MEDNDLYLDSVIHSYLVYNTKRALKLKTPGKWKSFDVYQ